MCPIEPLLSPRKFWGGGSRAPAEERTGTGGDWGRGLPSSRVAAPPGAPFAGDHARRPASDSMPAGPPLTQCPPARLWLNARLPAADSMPAGSPLTQARRIAADSMPAGPPLTQCPPARLWLNARRIAADSSPPDRRWLMPAGSPLTHARRIGAD